MATAEDRLRLLRQAQLEGKRLLSNKDFAPLELQPFIEESTASAPALSRLPRNVTGSRPRRVRSLTNGGVKRTAATSGPVRQDDPDEPVEKVKPRRRVPVGSVLLRKKGLGHLLPNAQASSANGETTEQGQDEREPIALGAAAGRAIDNDERAELKHQRAEDKRQQPSSPRPAEDPHPVVPLSAQPLSNQPTVLSGLVQHDSKLTEAEQAKRARLRRHVVAVVAAGIEPFRHGLSLKEQQSRSDEVISILIEKESRAGDYAVCDYVDLLPYKHRMMLKFVGGFFDKLKRRAKAQVEPSPVKTSSRQDTVPHGARPALGLLDEASQPRDRLEKAIPLAQTSLSEEDPAGRPAAPIDTDPLLSLAKEAGSVAHPEQSFGPTLDDFCPALDGDGGESTGEMDWEVSAGEIEGLGSPILPHPQAGGSISLGPRPAPIPLTSQTSATALATRPTEPEKVNYGAATDATSSPAFRADSESISPTSPSLPAFAGPAARAPTAVDAGTHDATSSTRLTKDALMVLAQISDSPLSSPASSSCDPADLASLQPLARPATGAAPGDATNHAGLTEAALAVLAQISDSPISSPASSVCDPADTAGTAGREGSTAQECSSKKKRKRVADAIGDDLEGAESEPRADKLAILEPFRQDPCFPALVKYVNQLSRNDLTIVTKRNAVGSHPIRILHRKSQKPREAELRIIFAHGNQAATGVFNATLAEDGDSESSAVMRWDGRHMSIHRGGSPVRIAFGRYPLTQIQPWRLTKKAAAERVTPAKRWNPATYARMSETLSALVRAVLA